MADVPINSLTPETVLELDSNFELQRSVAKGGQSRSASLNQMLLKSGPFIDERHSAVNLLDWDDIKTSDGSTDVSASVQAWQDQARAAGRIALAPAKILGISTSISIKAPTIGTGGRNGYGVSDGTQFSTVFKNIGINNASTAMLLINNLSDFYNRSLIKGIAIDGNYSAGVRAAMGLNANGSIGTGALELFQLDDVFALRCMIGIRTFGWSGIINRCIALQNRLVGLNLDTANAVKVNGGWYGTSVQGAWACRVQGSASAIKFSSLTVQSSVQDANGIDITEENVGVTLDTVYFEGHSGSAAAGDHTTDEYPTADTFHLRVGARSKAGGARTLDSDSTERATRNVTLKNCTFSGGAGDSSTYRGRRVYFGNVQGLRLSSDMLNARLQISSECVDVSGAVTSLSDSIGQGDGTFVKTQQYASVVTDYSGALGRPARSYIPNPNNHGAASGKVRGYAESYTHTSVSLANESTITRDGIRSLKITRDGDNTTNVSRGWYAKPYGQQTLGLNNRTVLFTGWLYIPNLGLYASRTGGPTVGIYSNGFIYSAAIGPAGIQYVETERWIRFCIWAKVANAGGYFGPYIAPLSYADNPGATAHWVLASDLALFSNPPSYEDVLAGRYTFAAEAGRLEGSAFITEAAAAPTNVGVHAQVGDKVYNSAPAPGGDIGWVCTTAGAPGVWKRFGAIEL